MLKDKKIGFIGSGAIAEALVKGLLNAGLVMPEQIIVNDISQKRLEYMTEKYDVGNTLSIHEIARTADVLFLTVKPQIISRVLDSISPLLPPATLVISVAAGIMLEVLEKKLTCNPIVRVMPNTPVAVGEGMSVLALGKYTNEENGKLALDIFCSVGRAIIMDEGMMDAVTGLSGSGPGYVFVLIDALADAGVRAGLSRQHSLIMAAQTLLGSAKMLLETGEHPGKLRDLVASPGGTTIAGIHVLEQKNVRAALIDAVQAATNRSQEMGKK